MQEELLSCYTTLKLLMFRHRSKSGTKVSSMTEMTHPADAQAAYQLLSCLSLPMCPELLVFHLDPPLYHEVDEQLAKRRH